MHLILKIGISRNTECVNTVGFPKLGHIYEIRGYSITVHDILFPDGITDSSKSQLSLLLHSEFNADAWFYIILKIAEGLEYIHQKHIVHRDLKTDNIAMYEQSKKVIPVKIDFGKSEYESVTKIYNLTEKEKQEYKRNHGHI